MKKILNRLIIGFILCNGIVLAENDFTLNSLLAERIQTNFSITGAFIGPGGSAGPVGESVVWPTPDASALFWNPAALAYLEKRSVIVDWVPGLQQDLASMVDDLDGKVEEALDDVREEYEETPGSATPAENVKMNASAGFHPAISGFGLAAPFKIGDVHGGVGFGYSTPIVMDFSILGSGFDVNLDTEEVLTGNAPTLINLRIRTGFNGALKVKTHQFVFGGGVRYGNTAIGFSSYRMKLLMSADLYAKIDGLLTIDGEEYHFNDPADTHLAPGESNSLEQMLSAEITGEGTGFKIGLVHEFSRTFRVGITYNQPTNLKLTARDERIWDTIPFISVEDSIDIDFAEIEPPKYNKTYRDTVKNQLTPTFEYPGSINFGMVLGGNGVKLALRYTIYNGDFSLGLFDNDIKGIKLKYGAGFGLDFKYFFLAASAAMGEEIIPVDKESILPTAILPKVNLGFRIPVMRNMLLTGLLGIEPFPILKTTFQYTF